MTNTPAVRVCGRVPHGATRSFREHVLRADARLLVRLVVVPILLTVLARLDPPLWLLIHPSPYIGRLIRPLDEYGVWLAGIDDPLHLHASDVLLAVVTWPPVAALLVIAAAITAFVLVR